MYGAGGGSPIQSITLLPSLGCRFESKNRSTKRVRSTIELAAEAMEWWTDVEPIPSRALIMSWPRTEAVAISREEYCSLPAYSRPSTARITTEVLKGNAGEPQFRVCALFGADRRDQVIDECFLLRGPLAAL